MTRGLYSNEQCKKKRKEKNVPAKTITSVQLIHLLVWLKTDMESIEHTEGGNLQKLGEVDKSGPINQKQQPVLKSGCLPPMSVKKQR